VKFSQSSYLHLFAAKRAIESPDFRLALYKKPLYFSPVLRNYAALTRNDADILTRVGNWLTLTESSETPPNGSFAQVAGDDDISATSIEDLLRQLSPPKREEGQPSQGNKDSSAMDSPAEWVDNWLDHAEDSDHEPFPLVDIEEATPFIRIMTLLTLTSNILRDSELVKDLKLKKKVLHRALVIWGKLVDLLETDEEFQQFIRSLAVNFSEMLEIPENRFDSFADNFCAMTPVLTGLSGISIALASRKLLRSLDACFADPDFISNTVASVMGALMGFALHEPGWTKYFAEVEEKHARVKAVRSVLMKLGQMSYYQDSLDSDDEARLLKFLVSLYAQKVAPRTASDRKKYEAMIAQQLKTNRIMSQARQQDIERRDSAEIESGEIGEASNPA
jgi:hypothetical protein